MPDPGQDPDDPGTLTYSEAVKAGLYGDQAPHADALDALATDSVQGPSVAPHFGRTQRDPMVRRPHRS